MNRPVLLIGVLISLCAITPLSHADIIKLKRGISFEGKVVDERPDAYSVELSVGVVEFKKDEVASIESFSDMQNDTMVHSWDSAPSPEKTATQASDAATQTVVLTENMFQESQDEQQEKKSVSSKSKKMSKDVYDIIEKDRAIQERRLKYLSDKKREEELQKKREKERQELLIPKKNSDDSSKQNQGTVMGSTSSSLLGTKGATKQGLISNPESGFKDFGGNKLGTKAKSVTSTI